MFFLISDTAVLYNRKLKQNKNPRWTRVFVFHFMHMSNLLEHYQLERYCFISVSKSKGPQKYFPDIIAKWKLYSAKIIKFLKGPNYYFDFVTYQRSLNVRSDIYRCCLWSTILYIILRVSHIVVTYIGIAIILTYHSFRRHMKKNANESKETRDLCLKVCPFSGCNMAILFVGNHFLTTFKGYSFGIYTFVTLHL